MFGIGISELVVILLIILVLINPKDLPKIARKMGQWAKKFKEARGKFDEEVKSIEKEMNKPVEAVNNAKESITIKQTLPDLNTIMPSRSTVHIQNIGLNGDEKNTDAVKAAREIQDKQDQKEEKEIESKV